MRGRFLEPCSRYVGHTLSGNMPHDERPIAEDQDYARDREQFGRLDWARVAIKSATRKLHTLSDHWETAYNSRRVSKHYPRLRLRRLKFPDPQNACAMFLSDTLTLQPAG
jgi:hypothetical protein